MIGAVLNADICVLKILEPALYTKREESRPDDSALSFIDEELPQHILSFVPGARTHDPAA